MPRALDAITFDFWSTLVDGAPDPTRSAQRLARLHEVLVGAGHSVSVDELRQAFRSALRRVREEARATLRDVGPVGRWAALAAELGLTPDQIAYAVVEPAYEDITLEPLPALMPHVEQVLPVLKQAGFRLAVICNTGLAGGRVLREVLRRYELLDYFDVTTWSNEFGWSKPDPRIFTHTLRALGGVRPACALHVGDMEDLDVVGAWRAGLYSARYAPEGVTDEPVETQADLLVRDWRAFPAQVEQLMARLAGVP